MQSLKESADQYYKEKNWKNALTAYTHLINHPNKDLPTADIYTKLAIVERFLKDYTASESTLKRGLVIFPKDISLIIEYATLENIRENWEESIKLWKVAKQLSRNFSELNYKHYAKAYLLLNESSILSNATLSYNPDLLNDDPLFKKAFIQNVVTQIIEIRNKKKNKALAVTYSENITKLIPSNNYVLLKELAISYMHFLSWHDARNTFEIILDMYHPQFNIYDYHRLAKCYEMSKNFDNYESLILRATKRYPEDINMRYRYIYATCINDYKEANFENILEKINLLLGVKKPDFWPIGKEDLLAMRNRCLKNTSLKSMYLKSPGMSIIASRDDGLGERLNAILNAIILAKTFHYKFGYVWKATNSFDYLQSDSKSNANLIGHALDKEHAMFSHAFIKQYSTTLSPQQYFKELSGKKNTYESILNLEVTNNLTSWLSPRVELKEVLADELLVNKVFSYKDAFSLIDFSEEITHAINQAKIVMNNQKYIALHLRSGDVFYGEYRKFVHYTYKGIVLPIAKAIIEKHLKEGVKIIVFGQDLEVLKYLKKTYSISTVDDFDIYSTFDDTQKAMFEIILMSESEDIIAGSSGFAKLASWIGDKDVKSPANYFTSIEKTEIIRNDLLHYGDIYPNLQTSFAYWFAYYYGRKHKDISEIEFLLTQAYKYDPDNQLYPLILASNYYSNHLEEKGNSILCTLFSLYDYKNLDKNPISIVLRGKTMGNFNIKEFLPSYELMASTGNPYASIVLYMLHHNNLQRSDECAEYLGSIFLYPQADSFMQDFYNYHKDSLKSIFISLGNTCEIGMAFKQYGYDKSSFFRYTYCNFKELLTIIENNFLDIYLFKNLIPIDDKMVKDTKYNINFHSGLHSKIINNKRIFIHTEEERLKIWKNEMKKINYFIQKQKRQFASTAPLKFFLKSDLPLNCSDLKQLVAILKEQGASNFHIIYITLQTWNVECNEQNITIEKVSFFPPETMVGHSDKVNYHIIFNKYSLPKGAVS